MNKEKQIKEMAKVMRSHCKIDNLCGSCHFETCNECFAEFLYAKGYRMALEVIRDFIEKAKEIFVPEGDYDGTDVIWNLEWIEAELKKKYTEGGE